MIIPPLSSASRNKLNSNKVGVYADKLYDLQVGLVLTSPAVVYLVNDNVNATGNISVLFDNFTFFLTSGGIGQNNTHYLPKGAKITSITNLNQAMYYYLTS